MERPPRSSPHQRLVGMRIIARIVIGLWVGVFIGGCRTASETSSAPTPILPLDENTLHRFQNNYYQGLKAFLLGDAERAVEYFKRASLLNPTDASTHYHLARLYLQAGNPQFAYRHARWAVRYAPDNPYYLELLATLERQMGRLDEAEALYERLIQQNPQKLDYYNQLLQLAIQREDFPKALTVLERAERQFGTNPEILRRKLSIHLFLRQYDQAEAVARQLLEANPKDLKTLEQLTRLFLARRDTAEAVRTLHRLIETHPEESLFKLELAKLYVLSRQYDSAEHLLGRIADDPSIPDDYKLDFLAQYGMRMFADDTLHDYAPLLQRFIDANPRDGRPYALRGDYFMQRGHTDSAYRMYRFALRYYKNFLPLWIRLIEMEFERQAYDSVVYHADEALDIFPIEAVLYFYKGTSLNRLRRYSEAVETFEEGLPYLPDDNPTLQKLMYAELAEAYYRLGHHERAFDYFEKALALDPHDPTILNNYAYYLSVVGVELDKAQKMSAQSLKAEPNNPAFLDTYGWILFKKGKYAQARQYIAKALEQRPNDPELLEHMGDVLLQLGRPDEAIEYWEKAIQHGGNEASLKTKIQQVRP